MLARKNNILAMTLNMLALYSKICKHYLKYVCIITKNMVISEKYFMLMCCDNLAFLILFSLPILTNATF